jgi:hypothetical protein
MKKYLLTGIVVLLSVTSCEKSDNEIFFRIGSGLEYKFSDIELYDTSTHILYFKEEHEEFLSIEKESFTFLSKGDPIYSGSFFPGYSSFMPSGPVIMAQPLMYGNYALRIVNMQSAKPDKRNDPEMIAILKKHDLFHSGLAVSYSIIEISGTQLTFRFTITNHDQSDLMIIDPDKTGPDLFHYFTNGLSIYDLNHNEVFSSTIQYQAPDPWNSWETDWLSVLESGDSKEFTINYQIIDPLNPGEYNATFEFPGLGHQLTKDQLYQGNSRIWLGDIALNKRITVQ